MEKLILTVNQYPWTSFFVFLGFYILIQLISNTVENIFNKIKEKQ